jgi:hypothetical protein
MSVGGNSPQLSPLEMLRIISLRLLQVPMAKGCFGMSWPICLASGIWLDALGVISMLPDSLVEIG